MAFKGFGSHVLICMHYLLILMETDSLIILSYSPIKLLFG